MLTIRMQNIKSAPFCPIFETPTAEAQQQANSSRALLAIFEKVDSKYCQRLNILVSSVCTIHKDKIRFSLLGSTPTVTSRSQLASGTAHD